MATGSVEKQSVASRDEYLPVIYPPVAPPKPASLQGQAFGQASARVAPDLEHRRVLRKATGSYYTAVAKAKSRFLNYPQARARAAQIKRDAIENLDKYLIQFEENVLANGGQVHWAQNADDARRIIIRIAQEAGVSHVVKGKSMVSEEVHLNDAFLKADIEPVETDLGEYICQLRGEPPYHIVTPVMHLTKSDISKTFHESLSVPRTEVAEELTNIARQKLRKKFVSAVMGTSGGNFLVADKGLVAITENEGNVRLSFSLPDVHVALVGIEKIIPRMQDLAVMWPMLSTSGTGQHVTCYSSMIGGPRRENDLDGPKEFHVVLLDNGRTKLLADPEQRDAAQCIRCGACLNVCPIYKSVGGHSYGTTYQGPIGSVITPHLKGLKHWKHLSYASSLCGNCTDVCPVKIDIHHHLLHNRRNAVQRGLTSWSERLAFKGWLFAMKSKARYRWASWVGRQGLWVYKALGLYRRKFANPVWGWTKSRSLPEFAPTSFADWWKKTEGGTKPL